MTCKEAIKRVYEYLDNELKRDMNAQVKSHLDLCRKCCDKFDFEQSLKEIIRKRLPVYKISETRRQHIVEQLAKAHEKNTPIRLQTDEVCGEKKRRVFHIYLRRPASLMAAAALFFLISGIGSYFAFFRPTPPSPIIREVAECHDQHIHGTVVLDMGGPVSNKLRRHSNDLLNFNFAIDAPESNKHETILLGCKNCYLFGEKSVHVDIEKKLNRRFSLEIIDGSNMNINNLNKEFIDGKVYHFGRHKDYNVLLWREGNTLYSLTSEAQKKELIHVAGEAMRMRRFRELQPFLPREK